VKPVAKIRKICEPIVEFLSLCLDWLCYLLMIGFVVIFFLCCIAAFLGVIVLFFPLSLFLLVPCSGGIVESTSLADAVGWTAWEEKRRRHQDESR